MQAPAPTDAMLGRTNATLGAPNAQNATANATSAAGALNSTALNATTPPWQLGAANATGVPATPVRSNASFVAAAVPDFYVISGSSLSNNFTVPEEAIVESQEELLKNIAQALGSKRR